MNRSRGFKLQDFTQNALRHDHVVLSFKILPRMHCEGSRGIERIVS